MDNFLVIHMKHHSVQINTKHILDVLRQDLIDILRSCKPGEFLLVPFYDEQSLPKVKIITDFVRSLGVGYAIGRMIWHRTHCWQLHIKNLITTKRMYDSSTRNSEDPSFGNLSSNFQRIFEHLPLFRDVHWRWIAFCDATLISVIASFIIGEIDYLDAGCCFMIICKWMEWLQNCNLSRSTPVFVDNMRNIEELMDRVRFCPHQVSELYTCMYDRFPMVNRIINDITKRVWRKRKRNEKCHRSQCKQMRRSATKWIRCSGCFIAAYCSRKCAKYDWTYGSHGVYCKMLPYNQFTECCVSREPSLGFINHH